MTTPNTTFNQENIVTVNPLNATQVKASERPIWLCKHPEAKIVSYDPRRYICKKCNTKYMIKILSQKDILTTLSTNTASIEHKE